jgi:hypothetical protein
VAAARNRIVQHFESNAQLQLNPYASEAEVLVLKNMAAQRLIRITTILPERDDHGECPKLSAWGCEHTENKGKTIAWSHFNFPMVYERMAAFTTAHGLVSGVPIPMYPALYPGETGLRIPFWMDIHGNFIEDVWDMVVRSILHPIVFRPGLTSQGIEKAHNTKLWTWEIEMVLEWMEKVGIVQKFTAGGGVGGEWTGGWRSSEWWYCAFLPEIATWKPPAGCE